MAITSVVQTNFTSGELDPRLRGHSDLRANANGASTLRNVFIQPLGGVYRRPGFRYIGDVTGAIRLIPFVFGTSESYVLVMRDLAMDVWRVRDWVQTAAGIAVPYTSSDYPSLAWTQSADTLLIVHPSHQPRKVVRHSDSDWSITTWTFLADTKSPRNRILQPHYKFADDTVTLASSATSGSGVTITASEPFFVAGHVGARFRRADKEFEITAIGAISGAIAVSVYVGNMTYYSGGLAKLFDDDAATYQAAWAPGSAGGYGNVWGGADFSLAPKQIASATVRAGPWGFGYYTNTAKVLTLRGSQTLPGGPDDGTVLGTWSGLDVASGSDITIASSDQTTAWDYVWIAIGSADERFPMIADIKLFAPALDPRSTTATATILETQAATTATTDWTEQAFSSVRGWPRTLTFHQDRLAIGGSRDLPNWLWMSQSADYFNFDIGTGLAAEAIELPILSDRVDAIVALISGPELQIFTTAGEFVVTGNNLTPEDVGLEHHTDVGSRGDRLVRPVRVDGATLYAARGGHGIHEFVYSDVERNFQAVDLATLAHHMISNPIEMAYLGRDRLFFVLNADGTLAVMTIYRAEKVSGWSRMDTSVAPVTSICGIDNWLIALLDRGTTTHLEVLDPDYSLDCSTKFVLSPAGTAVTGLDRLGVEAGVIADGVWLGKFPVASGSVDFGVTATNVEVGVPYSITVAPMPVVARRARLIRMTARVNDTQAFDIDMGEGAIEAIPMIADAGLLDTAPAAVSSDIEMRGGFWKTDLSTPLWTISAETPYAFNLLSTSSEISVND